MIQDWSVTDEDNQYHHSDSRLLFCKGKDQSLRPKFSKPLHRTEAPFSQIAGYLVLGMLALLVEYQAVSHEIYDKKSIWKSEHVRNSASFVVACFTDRLYSIHT